MIPLRRLWAQVTAQLFEEIIGIHHRVHTAFGQNLGRTAAFPLFQGKKRNRTIIYNAEYDSAGRLRRGVFFITTGSSAQPLSSEQWSIGRGWFQRHATPGHLQRLAGHVFDAVGEEWNLDLAPLKVPIKLVDWINGLATEFAQRNHLDPDHPQLVKCLRQIFVRGGHETISGQHYELPHEGLGGSVAAFALAACRSRVDQNWAEVFAIPDVPGQLWSKAPQLWINLTPGAKAGTALGFPRPSGPAADSPGGMQLACYPRPGAASSAENALRAVANLSTPSLYEVAASFSVPEKAGMLNSWSETLHAIGQRGEHGARIWSLTQPEILETTRQSIKAWNKSFGKWCQSISHSS